MDWQRGNIPFFTRPPKDEVEEQEEDKKINIADPDVVNPIEQVEGETKLTEAQSAIMGLIGQRVKESKLEN